MRIHWLVLLAGLLVSTPVESLQAQEEVLDSLIKTALENNPDLSAAAFMSQSARESTEAAGTLPDPSVSVALMNLPSGSFSLDRTPMSGVSVGVTQKIPWLGKLGAQSELAGAEYRLSQAKEELTRKRIIREVTDAYIEYSYWSKSKLIIENYLDLLEVTVEIAETRYASGESMAQDLLRASSMVSRTEVRLMTADQRLNSALLKLKQVVGDNSLSRALPAKLVDPADEHIPESIDRSPLLRIALIEVDQAQARKRLARHQYYPDISLSMDYRFRQDIAGDPIRGEDFLSFKVGFSLPLWFFAKQRHHLRSADQLRFASIQREISIRDQLTREYDDAISNLSLIDASIEKYDNSLLPEAQAALEAAGVAYEVGEIDFNALLTAQTDAFEIRLERLDLLRQFHKTTALLAELAGSKQEK